MYIVNDSNDEYQTDFDHLCLVFLQINGDDDDWEYEEIVLERVSYKIFTSMKLKLEDANLYIIKKKSRCLPSLAMF